MDAYPGFGLQRILLVRPAKRLHTPLDIPRLHAAKERPPETLIPQRGAPPLRVTIDASPQLCQGSGVGHVQAASKEARTRLAVDIVARVRTLAPGAREGGAEPRAVGGRVVGEADVAVDAHDHILDRQFGNGWIRGDDLVGESLDVGVPVVLGAAKLFVVGWQGEQAWSVDVPLQLEMSPVKRLDGWHDV